MLPFIADRTNNDFMSYRLSICRRMTLKIMQPFIVDRTNNDFMTYRLSIIICRHMSLKIMMEVARAIDDKHVMHCIRNVAIAVGGLRRCAPRRSMRRCGRHAATGGGVRRPCSARTKWNQNNQNLL